MLKRNWLLLLPTFVLFATPWFHKIIYNNILAAWPEMSHEGAHFIGLMGASIAFVATAIIKGTMADHG